MTVIRKSILDPIERDKFVTGVKQLKNTTTGILSSVLGVRGDEIDVSIYDLFVIWHHWASLVPNFTVHQRPVFLPWHRFMLILLEQRIQQALDDPTFGLPYWDWTVDGGLTPDEQKVAQIWDEFHIGGSGVPVSTGPFAYDENDSSSWRVTVETSVNGALRTVNRGLRRALGENVNHRSLPTKEKVEATLSLDTYDDSPWDNTVDTFRNWLEGWKPELEFGRGRAGLHNRVHVWVGGDMNPMSSPNDPVFFLHHCNIDRIWEAWMKKNGKVYFPDKRPQNVPEDQDLLRGQRIDSPMFSLLTDPNDVITPEQMLDVSEIYEYDNLPLPPTIPI